MGQESKFSFKELFSFIFSKTFLKHLGLLVLFFAVVITGILWWLDIYTNHGQKLVLPDYIETKVDKAAKDAKERKFLIVVDDSTHIVGKPGGIIIAQNPKPGSKVKENRKIYVTVTKYNPDKIKIKDLPSLYGRNYEAKQRELAMLKIKSKIKGYKYDISSPNNILEVFYKGKSIISKAGKQKDLEIEKGATLEFILSRKSGGTTDLPKLRCMTLEQAIFLIESRNLNIGLIRKNGQIVSDTETGFVTKQIPAAIDDIPMGTTVDLYISEDLPEGCN